LRGPQTLWLRVCSRRFPGTFEQQRQECLLVARAQLCLTYLPGKGDATASKLLALPLLAEMDEDLHAISTD
jgi:hypothetical protein